MRVFHDFEYGLFCPEITILYVKNFSGINFKYTRTAMSKVMITFATSQICSLTDSF